MFFEGMIDNELRELDYIFAAETAAGKTSYYCYIPSMMPLIGQTSVPKTVPKGVNTGMFVNDPACKPVIPPLVNTDNSFILKVSGLKSIPSVVPAQPFLGLFPNKCIDDGLMLDAL